MISDTSLFIVSLKTDELTINNLVPLAFIIFTKEAVWISNHPSQKR
ncbi:hypothetical protein GNIT_1422 [Glaciecola nitratireducens FR1064]|uniref:Uncharacterized protein n=1 Tax=Glaciecola nitratireducens (strain JCM 12485 / KCTC 12276 / FR1064) TaxID=1085623 RepID=G4QL70_GLANF|nr:hypothetical protein GNIT_1422 [Glaciecola nitratireducens FR1064]